MRLAKNGCNSTVTLLGKKVFYKWDTGPNLKLLGNKLDIVQYSNSKIKREYKDDEIKQDEIKALLIDWELYENGWYVERYSNTTLFNYLCQLGTNYRPGILNYFDKYWE